jgi:ferredoxin
MKRVSVLFYSQTGNSFACAKKAYDFFKSKSFDVTLCSIFQAKEETFDSDLLVFASPIFNFKLPPAMKDFIRTIPLESKAKKAISIMSYGGMASNTVCELQKDLKARGIELISYSLVKSEDSYIPLRKFVKFTIKYGKPDESSFKKLEKFLKNVISEEFHKKRALFNPLDPFHYLGAISPDDAPKNFLGKREFLEEKCTNCGNCYELCPTSAITNENGIKCDESLCTGCCGCFNSCPTNAWQSKSFAPQYYYKSPNLTGMLKFLRGK